jgi:hypothetical protein
MCAHRGREPDRWDRAGRGLNHEVHKVHVRWDQVEVFYAGPRLAFFRVVRVFRGSSEIAVRRGRIYTLASVKIEVVCARGPGARARRLGQRACGMLRHNLRPA